MSIIKQIKSWVTNWKKKEIAAYSDLVSDLRRGNVSKKGWQDVDEFLHAASPVRLLQEAGRLCAHLAYIFPGEISGMYSKEALPYLDEISEAMKRGEADLRETLFSIQKRLPDNEACLRSSEEK